MLALKSSAVATPRMTRMTRREVMVPQTNPKGSKFWEASQWSLRIYRPLAIRYTDSLADRAMLRCLVLLGSIF